MAAEIETAEQVSRVAIPEPSLLRDDVSPATTLSRAQAFQLYTSHFLSTWNVRGYEFAAIIFTARAWPDTLVAAAIRGIVRTVASILFSSSVGRWVDESPSRLKVLIGSITINRLAVIGASVLWYLIVDQEKDVGSLTTYSTDVFGVSAESLVKGAFFAMILLLGILEALSASANMLAMERDWIVTAAAPDGMPYDLTHLNSAMRRIDLICKLIAPVVMSAIISATNVKIGVLTTGIMSLGSWGVEVWCATRAWSLNPQLQQPKSLQERCTPSPENTPLNSVDKLSRAFQRYMRDFQKYFSSKVWIPSMSLALLHLSALSYGATFITFLLSVGISLDLITIARAAGSIVEISSTVVTPVGVKILGKAVNHGRYRGRLMTADESGIALLDVETDAEVQTETGLERLGLWGLSWQLLNLLPVVLALWALSGSSTVPSIPPAGIQILSPLPSLPLLTFGLFFFLSISRLGLWIYDLTTQQLTQTMTISSQRSSFTGVEYSFVSFFQLLQHIVTIVLHKPEQFKWVALMSIVAVVTSTVAYAGWVWKMRGHLLHWEKLSKSCDCVKARS